MKRIFYDNGHSLNDTGAIVGDHQENKIAIEIGERVKELGGEFDIVFVPDNLNLRETIAFIQERAEEGDLAVAIHLNANNNTDLKGVEAYYFKDSETAEIFTRNICKMTGQVNRGARADTETFVGSLGFVRKLPCKSVLIECGYMTNPTECWNLTDLEFQNKIAKGIVNAIKEVELKNEIYTLQQKLVALLESWIRVLQGKI